MGKVVHNLGRGPVLDNDELAPDLAITIDGICLGVNVRPVKCIAVLLRVADGEEIDLMPGKETVVGLGILVQIDAHHHQLRHLTLQLIERGNLFHARRAPAGPEIEQNYLAAVAAQLQAACAVGDSKIRCGLVDLLGMVTAIAACGKQQQTQNHVRAKTPDHTSIIMTNRRRRRLDAQKEDGNAALGHRARS
jgi:hypothetical protein